MTVIEFFDLSSIENLAATLLLKPQKTIFLTDKSKKVSRALPHYTEVLSARGIDTALESKSVAMTSLGDIVESIAALVEENENCVFDLTGGSELYLVAVGVLLERMGDRIGYVSLRLRSGTMLDSKEGRLPMPPLDLTAEEMITMTGGSIVTEAHDSTFDMRFTDEISSDIDRLWSIVKKDPRGWNKHVGALSRLIGLSEKDGLNVYTAQKAADLVFDETKSLPDFLKRLSKAGFLSLSYYEDEINLHFKNDFLMQALSVAGLALEAKIASRLTALRDKDGTPLYHDVRIGTIIDWDEKDDSDVQTLNEIDVIAVKDSVPIFISCKNGNVDIDELYKLKTVTHRFGGMYAKGALIVTDTDALGKKAIQLSDAPQQVIHLILGKFISNGEDDLLVEKAVQAIHTSPFCRQLNDGNTGIALAFGLGDVTFFDQLIHAHRHRGHRDVQNLGDLTDRAAAILAVADALQRMKLCNA